LLYGFIEKSQKTPKKRIELAVKRQKNTNSMNNNPYTGSSFDDFLEEGLYEECTAIAIKRVLARQLSQEMKRQNLTKTEMAKQMQTSRAQLNRLLDPEKTGVSIETITRAASVVGRQLRIELV
jgi:antitoxin HicB